MTGFSAEWLALREPHDAAARAADLVAMLGTAAAPRAAGTPLWLVDLGAGSGANLRWLAPKLGGEQSWLLVDHDAALLAAAERAIRDWSDELGAEIRSEGAELVVSGAGFSCRVRRTRADLAADLERVELPARAVVTSSALLDLVSAEWLAALASRCRAATADACFALTYDGRTVCSPGEPEDAEVLELFNRHQRGDKGFGPALGPTAAARAAEIFTGLGYRVATRASDWRVGADADSFQRELLAGWQGAALEMAPGRRAALDAWHRRRVAHVEAGRSALVVGHVDVVALCPR